MKMAGVQVRLNYYSHVEIVSDDNLFMQFSDSLTCGMDFKVMWNVDNNNINEPWYYLN